MDNVEAESDYIEIDGGIINAAFVKSLGFPVGAVREFVRRLAASDERIVRHIESLDWTVPRVWEFLRRLGKSPKDRGMGKQIEAATLNSLLDGLAGGGDTAPSGTVGSAKGRGKRSTAKGDAQAKIIAALTLHHEYQDGSCLNQSPIGSNELARAAHVTGSTASKFFNDKWGKKINGKKKNGHRRYQTICQSSANLIASLKLLNGDFIPNILLNRLPSDNGGQDDE